MIFLKPAQPISKLALLLLLAFPLLVVEESSAEPVSPGAVESMNGSAQATTKTQKKSQKTDSSSASRKKAAKPAASLPSLSPTDQPYVLRRGDSTIFQLLVAEMAFQRNDLDLAADMYARLSDAAHDPKVYERGIEAAVYAQRLDLALDIANAWIRFDPESSVARQTAVAVLLALDQIRETEPHLAKLLALGEEKRAANFLQLPNSFTRQSDRKAVLELVQSLAGPYPDLPEAHLAVTLAAKGTDDALALKEANRALELRPDWDVAAILAGQLLNQESPDKAIRMLSGFLEKNPQSREARLFLARVLFTDKRYDEARKQYQLMLKEAPDDPDVVFPLAVLALEQNDLTNAEQEFKKLLDLDFRDKNTIRYYLGLIVENRGNRDEAKSYFDSVTGGDQYIVSKRKYAQILAKEGKLDEARHYLQEANARNAGERAQLILTEAVLLRDEKKTGEALALVEQAITAQPSQPELLYDGALLADRLKRHDLADTWLKRLIELQPRHAHALNALGYSYIERGINPEAAEQLIDSALEIAPNDPFIIDSKGWLLFTQGKLDKALDELQRAYKIRPDPEIAAHVGEVQWKLGREQDAEKSWDEGQKLDPDNESLKAVRKKYKP